MYNVSILQEKFEIEQKNNALYVNNTEIPLQLSSLPDGGYEININGEKTIADIVKIDKSQKLITLRIKNKRYVLHVKEPVDLLLEKLGVNTKLSRKVNNLKAPMPGLVSKLLVSNGEEVKAGQPLLILEAMKMENVFKASGDAKIKAIKVNEKQAVEKGEELIAFE